MVQELTRGLENVLVASCSEPLLEFARKHKARVIIRFLRSLGDFEREFERAKLHKDLFPDVETIFLTSRPELFYTSEMVKEIASFGGSVSSLVPPRVERELYAKLYAGTF